MGVIFVFEIANCYERIAERRRSGLMDYILQTKQLSKKYQDKLALDKVSIHIPENSVYGLLGPNGAGKSTLLKIISGIAKPSAGEVLFEEHRWNRDDIADIGALIETPPIYPNLTAYENMKIRAMIYDVDEKRINEILELVGLQGEKKKRAGKFSLGMKQRLGIAVSILNNPKFLILDEPTNGLDPFGIEELRGLIRGFVESGITVLISSHILSEIQLIADYIGILSDGELKYEGKIDEGQNLETLFMDIARNRREVACSI